MGKNLRYLALFLVILLICTFMIIPFLSSDEDAQAANPAPYSDLYGFIYPDGVVTINGVQGYSFGHNQICHFSGIENYWNWDYPSTKLSILYNGWPVTAYNNKSKTFAKNYLGGNAEFVFYGHGTMPNHYLKFYDGSSFSSLTTFDILYYAQNLDDMKFACLISCKSNADSNMASAFRAKLVDMVLGFTDDVCYSAPTSYGYVYPAHVYNQEFWRAAEIMPNTNVQSSMAWAITWVNWHCGTYGGLDSHNLLGKSNDTPPDYVKWVEDGRIGQ
jgi:hypothetical protein